MSTTFDFGGFELSIARAVRELKQDFKDDFFPDPLKFRDCLDVGVIHKYYTDNVNLNHGNYEPEKTEPFNVPKKGFLLRYSLESNVFDRLVYLGLVSEIIPFYDPLLSNNSFSHRYNSTGEGRDKKYIFKHHVEQFKAFEGLIKANSRGKTLLLTDVFNYYENIQVTQLKSCLERKILSVNASTVEKVKIRRVIELLASYLKKWTYNGESGLPQSRDASSFLANILMDDIDKEMERLGFKYYRYMDDIRIICDNEFQARSALKILTVNLRKIGLNLNSSKTKIGALNAKEIKDSFMVLDRNLEAIDSMWKSKSLTLISNSIPHLKKYLSDNLATGSSSERSFRFAVGKVGKALSCEELNIPSDYFDNVTNTVIADLAKHPTATDQLVRYLTYVHLSQEHIDAIIDFMCDGQKAIYSWQNLHLWKLMMLREVNHPKLHVKANSLISCAEETKVTDIAGAALYLGKFGDVATKKRMLSLFKVYNSSWLQRTLLIAVHELNFTNDGVKDIASFTRESAKGTFKRVKDNIRVYIDPPEKTNFKDLYDEVSIYDW